MVEEVQAADTSVQDQAPIAAESQSVQPAAEAPQQAAAPAEKMIPQSQVSRIAAREAREAAEKARAEAQAQFEQERAQMYQAQQQQAQPGNLGGMQQYTPEQLREAIRQEAMLMTRQQMAQQIEHDFKQKIATERDTDPDFAELYDALGIENHADLVLWINGMDNSAKIVKDLAQNPSKFSNVLMLARSGSPELARRELNKLSASIKANIEAQKQPVADAPLGQLKPSNIGADNGDMTVSDYRLMFKG